jgi:hypothetical protein
MLLLVLAILLESPVTRAAATTIVKLLRPNRIHDGSAAGDQCRVRDRQAASCA